MDLLTYQDPTDTPQQFQYMLLSRLKMDCDYFLGYGNRREKELWAGSVKEQISEMRKLYDILGIKPEWLTLEEIEAYEKAMQKTAGLAG